MALTDATRDRLRSLSIVAAALGSLAESAAENANDDNVQTDPLMSAVRSQFLTAQKMGVEFLSIDRPNTAGSRIAGSVIKAWVVAENVSDPLVVTGAQVTASNAFFKDATTYSKGQVFAWMFDEGIDPNANFNEDLSSATEDFIIA